MEGNTEGTFERCDFEDNDFKTLKNSACNSESPNDDEATTPLTLTTAELDIDGVLTALKLGKFQYMMLSLSGGAYFAACTELILFVFLSKPVKEEWNLNDMMFPLLPFFCGIMRMVGSFTFGTLSDKFGRQLPFLCAMLCIAVFGLASAFVPWFWLFVLVRALVIFGTSGIEAVDFVLLLEFLPAKNRGCFMVTVTFCGASGAVLAAGLAWWLLPSYGWRAFVAACSVPSFIILVYRMFVRYESPRSLFIRGKRKEGMEVLRAIARYNGTALPTGEIVCHPSQKRGQVTNLFTPQLRTRTLFITCVWVFQSMGYWGVTMYLPEYMSTLGIDPYFNTFSVFVGELPGLCLAMILIEPHMLGRLNCLRFFSFFSALFLLLFAFIEIEVLKAVFVIIVFFFIVPIYSILNTFTPEIFPTDTRSISMAWVYFIISIPSLVTAFLGASLLSSSIKWLYPTVSAGFLGLEFLFTLGLNVETAGKSLKDVKEVEVKSDEKSDSPDSKEKIDIEMDQSFA